MARATNSVASRKRHKKTLKYARGYFGNKSKLFRYAKEAVQHAWQYAYIHRRKKKSDRRGLWIVRLNAACRAAGISYSRFIEGLKAANILLDRKVLSDLAIRDELAFSALVQQAKGRAEDEDGVSQILTGAASGWLALTRVSHRDSTKDGPPEAPSFIFYSK